jgi:prophage regulatory protein
MRRTNDELDVGFRIRAALDVIAQTIADSIIRDLENRNLKVAPSKPPAAAPASTAPAPQPRGLHYLRIREVAEMTSLSRSFIYRHEAAGTFPRRRHLGPRSVAWRSDEIEEWMQSRS